MGRPEDPSSGPTANGCTQRKNLAFLTAERESSDRLSPRPMRHSMRSVSLAFPCRGINSEHKMALFKSEFLSIPQENCQEKSHAADV